MVDVKNVLFLGGLNSKGNKGRYIEQELKKSGVDVNVDIITPDYINVDADKIFKDIDDNEYGQYDYIVASSTGGLFLLNLLKHWSENRDHTAFDPLYNIKGVIFINPLFTLSEELKEKKDQAFLMNISPLLQNVNEMDFSEFENNFAFFVSEHDEVIGSQLGAIDYLNFPKKKCYIKKVKDEHRFSKSMNYIVDYLLKDIKKAKRASI